MAASVAALSPARAKKTGAAPQRGEASNRVSPKPEPARNLLSALPANPASIPVDASPRSHPSVRPLGRTISPLKGELATLSENDPFESEAFVEEAPMRRLSTSADPPPPLGKHLNPDWISRNELRPALASPPLRGFLQAKLEIGAVDDPLEREADAVADAVMRMLDPAPSGDRVVPRMHAGAMRTMAAPSAQAKRADCLGEERLQRQVEDDEAPDELVQAKAKGPMDAPVSVRQALEVGTDSGTTMHPSLRNKMESAFDADFSGVRIHTGAAAERLSRHLSAHAFTHGRDIFFNAGEYRPDTTDGRRLLAHELTHVVQQSGVSRAPREEEGDKSRAIEGRAIPDLIQRDAKEKADYVPYQIQVSRPMSREEFQALAMRQIFGAVAPSVRWEYAKDSYVPDKSPYLVKVELQLLKKNRGEASRERGITVESGGGITGAEERAKTFQAEKESDEKSALMNEIDRRYFEAVGDATKTKIKQGEKGKAALWRMIRDEVLFQHEYIKNLPPGVKELIKVSISGRDLTPADYDKLFAIAKKIENMPAGQASDFATKVTGSTTDLNVFEASLDKYIAEAAARDTQTAERDKIQTKLLGLEEFYKRYRFVLLGGGGAAPGPAWREAFDREIRAYGFTGLAEFEEYIKKFEAAFEAGAQSIVKDLLAKFAGKLYKESERYKDPGQVRDLHQKLAVYRASYAEFETNAPIWNQYAGAQQKAEEQQRIPGQGHLKTSDYTSIAPEAAEAARKKAETAKASAQSQFVALSRDYPIFQEEGLPDDKKLNKAVLAKADESRLAALLQAQIQMRMGDVEDAKNEVGGKSELIYKMPELMPQFYAQMGIRPGSIQDMIIQDKMKSDLVVKIVKGIAFAIVAIALAVVSFGTATPAIVAAGAAIAGAGLGVYQAYEAYQEYVEDKSLADVGLAKDPTIAWFVIAVLGAALDMGMAVKAIGMAAKSVRELGPAAKALEAGGELADFNKAVRALENANEIDAKIARAVEKAAAARKSLKESTKELSKALGKAYSFPGPLTDPEVYKALYKMARDAVKTKVYDAAKFLEEIKLARINAKLGDLTPEELAKVKQAWEEAKAFEAAEAAVEAAERSRVGSYTTKIEWGIQKGIEARPHTSIKGAFWGRRTVQGNARVNAYELKINPNNESFFLPHPKGGLVQFENVVGTSLVQDGKLVMQTRSIYHVADMPPFAAKQVLEEAGRQVAAAQQAGLKVEWLVSEARAEQQLTALFQKNNIPITVSLYPE
jgi:Domain of unknown function (DUF4157)